VDPEGAAHALSRRVAGIAQSATVAIDDRTKALWAAGRPVIGLSTGDPDFPTPAPIVAVAVAACADPRQHHYSPAAGHPDLRKAIAAKTRRDSRLVVGPDQVLVTNGGKQAVYQAFATLLDPGDEVLLPAPYWTTYPEAIRLAGGVAVPVPTGAADGYLPAVEQLNAALTPRTKALLWCSPSNPTGAVAPPALTGEIGRWAAARGLWVVADEIYEHLVYEGAQAVSMPVAAPELADRFVIVNGVTKSYAMTGWRVGWLIGPPAVVAAATSLQSHLSSHVSNVGQRAALAAVTGPLDAVEAMRVAFDRRRSMVLRMLAAVPGVTCPTPHGAFYAFPDVGGLLGRSIGGTAIDSSAELAAALLEHADVAVVPGEAFGSPGHLRLSYAVADEDLEIGLGRMVALLGCGSP